MAGRKSFSPEEARLIGAEIGIDWETVPFDVEQLRSGMDVELEHSLHDVLTNVSGDDPHVTAKVALAHLNEFPDSTRASTAVVASPRLLEVGCRSIEQMRMANALCRFVELVA